MRQCLARQHYFEVVKTSQKTSRNMKCAFLSTCKAINAPLHWRNLIPSFQQLDLFLRYEKNCKNEYIVLLPFFSPEVLRPCKDKIWFTQRRGRHTYTRSHRKRTYSVLCRQSASNPRVLLKKGFILSTTATKVL